MCQLTVYILIRNRLSLFGRIIAGPLLSAFIQCCSSLASKRIHRTTFSPCTQSSAPSIRLANRRERASPSRYDTRVYLTQMDRVQCIQPSIHSRALPSVHLTIRCPANASLTSVYYRLARAPAHCQVVFIITWPVSVTKAKTPNLEPTHSWQLIARTFRSGHRPLPVDLMRSMFACKWWCITISCCAACTRSATEELSPPFCLTGYCCCCCCCRHGRWSIRCLDSTACRNVSRLSTAVNSGKRGWGTASVVIFIFLVCFTQRLRQCFSRSRLEGNNGLLQRSVEQHPRA